MKIKCQCGVELEINRNIRSLNSKQDDLIIEVEPHLCSKPLEFPALVTINGRAMDVESVIPFPLEGTTRNLFYKRSDPDVERPVLVQVVSRE